MPETPDPVPSQRTHHLSPDEFRVLGRRMVDVIASYWETVESRRVTPDMRPGDLLAKLPASPPNDGLGDAGWDAAFRDIAKLIEPALTHWQSPNFFGYFPANASFPAILGEMLSAGFAQQGMLWATSPACTELEMRVMDWLVEMLGLPGAFRFEPLADGRGAGSGLSGGRSKGGGVIQGTASEALVSALVAARWRARRTNAGDHRPLVAYASTQAHSSFVKACMIVGLANDPEDRECCRLIDVDDGLAMRADLLEAAMREDLAGGKRPFFVMGTIGTTSSTAVDSIAAIAGAIRSAHARTPSPLASARPGIFSDALSSAAAALPWLHVDAAHAGSLLLCPEFRHFSEGMEHADSFCFNPHKWMLTNFDCDCFFTRDREALTSAMSIAPEYLRNAGTEQGAVDYRDWHVPLGRRFRALKLWLVIRHYGVEGLRAFIRGHVEHARLFESLVRDDPRFEVCAPRTMNLVCFRLVPRPGEAPPATDSRTKALLDRLNASGKIFLSHTVLPRTPAQPHPRLVLRMAIGATLTQERHVREAWALVRKMADGFP